ncbi:MAG: NUDIX domain-containing protein [Candidatus Paceibacterota bacterium]|jgi:isopentenyldiphosphate isomerase
MRTELVSIFNKLGIKKGRATAEKAHKEGLWHRSAHVWVYTPDGRVLLQQRAKSRHVYPSRFDMSAAGHVPANETPKKTAVREAFEEIHLMIDPMYLKKIEVIRTHEENKKTHWTNNEFDYIFIYPFEGDPKTLKINYNEVEGLRFIPLYQFEAEIHSPRLFRRYAPHTKRYYLSVIRAIREELKHK